MNALNEAFKKMIEHGIEIVPLFNNEGMIAIGFKESGDSITFELSTDDWTPEAFLDSVNLTILRMENEYLSNLP